MAGYPERFVKLLYGIIMAQFIVIATLLAGFSNEYLSNIYFRIWVDSNFPQLGLLLTGQVDALLIGMALGGTIRLIQRVKNERGIAQGTPTRLGRPTSSRKRRLQVPKTSPSISRLASAPFATSPRASSTTFSTNSP